MRSGIDSENVFFLFYFLALMIFVFSRVFGKNKKKDAKPNRNTAQTNSVNRSNQNRPASATVQKQRPASVQHSSKRPTSAAPKPQPQPLVRESMKRDPLQVSVRLTPHDHSGMFDGSMGLASTEGEDACHPGEHIEMPSEHSDQIFLEENHELPVGHSTGSVLNFSKDALMQSLILQEVLKRPSERTRRT